MSKQKSNLNQIPELFTPLYLQEVIFRNQLSKNNIYNLIHSTGFPKVKIGNKYFISKDGFKKWIEEKEEN